MNASAQPVYREVVDDNGRVYRIGETDRDILGRSRAWMVWLPWIAMMAISSSEYAFTSAEDTLVDAHHWRGMATFSGCWAYGCSSRQRWRSRPAACGKAASCRPGGDDARCRWRIRRLSVAGLRPARVLCLPGIRCLRRSGSRFRLRHLREHGGQVVSGAQGR